MGILDRLAGAMGERQAPTAPRTAAAKACPRCGSGPDKREDCSTFGKKQVLCTDCAYEFPEGQ